MSKRSAALVGAAGMNDKKRGLSHDTTASASRPNTSSTCAGSFPSAPTSPSRTVSSDSLAPPKSSGTGSRARRRRQ